MTVTVTELVLRAREQADMVNSTFVSDAEAIRFVSAAYKRFYDLIVSKFQDYKVADPYSFTISSGESASLPADFLKLLGVDRLISGTEYVDLKPFNFNERNNRRAGTATVDVTGTYRLWYVPAATALTAGSDTVEGYNGWEDMIVFDAARRMLGKEESDISVVNTLFTEIKESVERAAQQRDLAHSDRITDVYRDDGPYYDPWSAIRYRIIGSAIYFKSW